MSRKESSHVTKFTLTCTIKIRYYSTIMHCRNLLFTRHYTRSNWDYLHKSMPKVLGKYLTGFMPYICTCMHTYIHVNTESHLITQLYKCLHHSRSTLWHIWNYKYILPWKASLKFNIILVSNQEDLWRFKYECFSILWKNNDTIPHPVYGSNDAYF